MLSESNSNYTQIIGLDTETYERMMQAEGAQIDRADGAKDRKPRMQMASGGKGRTNPKTFAIKDERTFATSEFLDPAEQA